jgi:hypothetical protein
MRATSGARGQDLPLDTWTASLGARGQDRPRDTKTCDGSRRPTGEPDGRWKEGGLAPTEWNEEGLDPALFVLAVGDRCSWSLRTARCAGVGRALRRSPGRAARSAAAPTAAAAAGRAPPPRRGSRPRSLDTVAPRGHRNRSVTFRRTEGCSTPRKSRVLAVNAPRTRCSRAR